jgi:hypothetical protein
MTAVEARKIDALCEGLSLEWDSGRRSFTDPDGNRISLRDARRLMADAASRASLSGETK